MLLFDVRIDFLYYGLLKLSRVGFLHFLMLVEVVRVFACGKHYGIQHVFLCPQVVFLHGVIVVVALFSYFCVDVNTSLDLFLSLIFSAISLILSDLLTCNESWGPS